MIRPFTVLLAASLLATAAPALAAPYGQAQMLQANSQAEARGGYRLTGPDLLATVDGVRAHGMICRQAGQAGIPARQIQLQHLDATGQVLATAHAPVRFDSVRRSASCTVYDLATAWKIDPADTVLARAL